MPLLTFIIPVRHPLNAANWAEQVEFLKATAQSVSGQIHEDWDAVVIANHGAALPELPVSYTHLTLPTTPYV